MDQSYITNYIYTNIIEHKDKKQWINEYLPLREMSAYLCFQIRLLRQTNVTTSGLKFYMSKKRKLPTLKNFKDWLKINLDKNTNK